MAARLLIALGLTLAASARGQATARDASGFDLNIYYNETERYGYVSIVGSEPFRYDRLMIEIHEGPGYDQRIGPFQLDQDGHLNPPIHRFTPSGLGEIEVNCTVVGQETSIYRYTNAQVMHRATAAMTVTGINPCQDHDERLLAPYLQAIGCRPGSEGFCTSTDGRLRYNYTQSCRVSCGLCKPVSTTSTTSTATTTTRTVSTGTSTTATATTATATTLTTATATTTTTVFIPECSACVNGTFGSCRQHDGEGQGLCVPYNQYFRCPSSFDDCRNELTTVCLFNATELNTTSGEREQTGLTRVARGSQCDVLRYDGELHWYDLRAFASAGIDRTLWCLVDNALVQPDGGSCPVSDAALTFLNSDDAVDESTVSLCVLSEEAGVQILLPGSAGECPAGAAAIIAVDKCDRGYMSDPGSRSPMQCVDVNECRFGDANTCTATGSCVDTEGSYECRCNEGYSGDGEVCANYNECAGGDVCGAHTDCTDSVGSFECACQAGYIGDPAVGCRNENECDLGPCSADAACADTDGSFECTCHPGFTGTGDVCVELNECATMVPPLCGMDATCTDIYGSFECACNTGYLGDGLACDDVNECRTNNECSTIEYSTCENSVGSYACGCSDGFILDLESPDFTCINDNECNNGICSENAVCIDSDGSFECECNAGWLLFNGNECLDTDECDETAPDFAEDFCTGDNERCSNEPGGRSCICIIGHGRDASGFCQEVPNLNCDGNPHQINCSCNAGFRGNPVYPGLNLDSCLDIDECHEVSFDCKDPQLPRCHNTAGSYLCLGVVTSMPSSSMPTAIPTRGPSQTPTVSSPSATPTHPPTGFPLSSSPTGLPTTNPTASPSPVPTLVPSSNPTASPTLAPTTGSPTDSPTGMPTFIILASNDAEADVSISTAMIVMLSLLLAGLIVHQVVKKVRKDKSSSLFSGEDSLLPLPTRHSSLPYVNSNLDLTSPDSPDLGHRSGLSVNPAVLSAISTSSIPLSPRLFSSTSRNLGSPAPEQGDDPFINPARFNSSRAGRNLGSPVTPVAGDNIDPRLPSPSILAGMYAPLASDLTYEKFDAIPTNHLKMGSQDPILAPFNRYRNILPNPGSHVQLTSKAGMGSKKDPGSFPYINANFVRGWNEEPQVYIASQGPKAIGIPQFWRMIWQEEVSVVVMLTSLKENKGGQIRDKCAQYWSPDVGGTARYAKFNVTTVSKNRIDGGYLKTVLRVECKRESRTVTHFWYDTWPDLGVPKEDASQLVDLIVDSNGSKAQHNTPILVHCSAGIGRTGAFVALDRALNALRAGKRVDLIAEIKSMRKDRGGMVQTHEQAKFVATLLEKISPPEEKSSSTSTHLAHPASSLSDTTTQDEAAVVEFGKPVFSVAGASIGASTTDANEAADPYAGTDSENDESAEALVEAGPAPDGSVEVTITKGSGQGFGLEFAGPGTNEEAKEVGWGIFLKQRTAGGAAQHRDDVPVGWQIFSMNGKSLERGTFMTLEAILRSDTGSEMTLVMVPNRALCVAYGLGHLTDVDFVPAVGPPDDDHTPDRFPSDTTRKKSDHFRSDSGTSYGGAMSEKRASTVATALGDDNQDHRPRASSFNIDVKQAQGTTAMSGVVSIEAVNLYDSDSWLHLPPAKTTSTTFDKLVARNTTGEDGVFIIERHPQSDDKYVLTVTFHGRPTRHLFEKNKDGIFTINRRQYGDFSTVEDLVGALSDANTLPQGWPVRLANLIIPDAEVEPSDSKSLDSGGAVNDATAARPRSPALVADDEGLFAAELIDFAIPSEWQNGLTAGKEVAFTELMRFKSPEEEKIADGICFFEKHDGASKTVLNVTYNGRPTRHLIEQNGDGIFTVNRKAFGDHGTLEGLLRALSTDPLPGNWPVRLAKIVLKAA